MKHVIKLFTLFIITLLFACSTERKNCNEYCAKLKKNSTGQTIVRLQQQWFPNSGFAGELFAQSETDSINGIEIEIIAGSDLIDTKQVVLLDAAEFGVAGAEQIMQANEAGAGLVVIGVINYKSLACFISKKHQNIVVPKDMEGHKIGTMEGSPVDLIYKVLKNKENLKIKKKDEIPTGWVLTGFKRDIYDIYPAFINDEPITLRLEGISVNIIHPSYYGVNFIGTVYFCKKELVECCPEVVQSFINSISQGWELTMKDPKQAISLLMKFDPNLTEKKEIESLISGMEYYRGEGGNMLYTNEKTWNDMAEDLKSIGMLSSFDYKSTVDNKFVAWYLMKVKKENDTNVKK